MAAPTRPTRHSLRPDGNLSHLGQNPNFRERLAIGFCGSAGTDGPPGHHKRNWDIQSSNANDKRLQGPAKR
ncbi:hypothetical protein E2C01_073592 [Portunus trituberculatus]|uniref:Uncharacterized protein n=1 Tax=Portunus trituberculatus TaxID=210409 RepID=A0A5B7I3F3_PORTR|nr:hypothetical protein [Portunus trituberculatus]